MDVRWTAPAGQDLENIASHIGKDDPEAARRVVKALYEGAMSLDVMPNRGRSGRVVGTRELVFSPYIVVYRVTAAAIEILRIYHGAQDWP